MHIVFAASECVPWAKTGGLADVVGALPPVLVRMGHRVTTFVPYYRQVARKLPDLPTVIQSLTIPFPSYQRYVRVLDGGIQDGVQVYFFDCPEMFDRESFYATPGGDYLDNWERFSLYSRAVIEASKILGVPDVFHAHDWQAALVPIYLRSIYFFDPVLRKVPCVFTIHNAGYQGWFPADTMPRIMLPWDMFTLEKLEAYDNVNLLKGGLVYADALTTVSRRYAEEIQTPEFGNGLDDIFRRRSGDLFGILNGVDYDQWDPARDAHIAAHYSADNLKGKKECRRDLLHAFGLDHVEDTTAVLGIVSRFATQKGFDLLAGILHELIKDDVVLIALGTGEEYYERLLSELAARYPDKVRVDIRYDNTTAHKIEAGSDIFLMPSHYEPSGLNQMYSLRYGTVPVVRSTGGLEDTIVELHEGQGNGFKFHGYNQWDFLDAIRRAVATFQNKEQWEAMMRRGMEQDFSWNKPAEEYIRVYERVIEGRAWS
ncbi:glycogen/starch synthase, ADP-glucose type [Terriglobus roseus DSM 18391]|uniref:Glycogen synthase n=1 Tax=Terriglobus roseus (strain DSM 18391 / NRRL B-41598 / KBS 63) TaxID=926566 RepID=I3ZH30_TERRK|nr:glycogen synthase GlgA [Terriglobus roseus]AFL88548.1 glycogen/starch synthase, ADP-glucose type [Terriglobus roseus DSM 18391]AFL88887.1 glycogen/starch synthase, ADP-glucose type [Terriglobus roseus DSM 18391]